MIFLAFFLVSFLGLLLMGLWITADNGIVNETRRHNEK